ncbi:hypothetical protein [Halobaculum sp. D14]|uniref:hypothetical protein n=1 Tax=unclassified Halobaculum TaxID=2640896 RepID=UPI003EC0E0F4
MSRDDTLASFGGGVPADSDDDSGTDDAETETEPTEHDTPECVDCGRSTPTTTERVPYSVALCPSCYLDREGIA